MLKICPNCGNEVEENFKFCEKCGTKLINNIEQNKEEKTQDNIEENKNKAAIRCPICKTKIENEKFCPTCGQKITENIQNTNQNDVKSNNKTDSIKLPQTINNNNQNNNSTNSQNNTNERNTKDSFNQRPTKKCKYCGASVDVLAEICPNCGVRLLKAKSEKNPGLALIFSFLLPGLGQIYNEETKKGIIILISAIISAFLIIILIGALLYLIIWIYGMYDAYNTAKEINEEII
ncbi:MAG: zinc ribbon domain-containing protein [archaeon]|nr:zinc ribbon domain-containing protein [archaeon]